MDTYRHVDQPRAPWRFPMSDERHLGITIAVSIAACILALIGGITWWALAVPNPTQSCTGGAYYIGHSGGSSGERTTCPNGAQPSTPPIENWNGQYYLVCVCPGAAGDAAVPR